jgi:hypothetical protein
MNVEDDPDDGIRGMVEELYTAKDKGKGKGKKSMFAILLEEMKQKLYHNAHCLRFSFVVKLLHIKSFYWISNVAFTTLLKLVCNLQHLEAPKLVRLMCVCRSLRMN